jgi:hypothetical protein
MVTIPLAAGRPVRGRAALMRRISCCAALALFVLTLIPPLALALHQPYYLTFPRG